MRRRRENHVVVRRRRAVEAKDGDSVELELHSRDERTHEPAVLRREVLRPPLALFDESEPGLSLGLWESVQNPCVPVPHDNWATEIADSGHGCSWFGPEGYIPQAHEFVDLAVLELREYRFERRQIAVNVRNNPEEHLYRVSVRRASASTQATFPPTRALGPRDVNIARWHNWPTRDVQACTQLEDARSSAWRPQRNTPRPTMGLNAGDGLGRGEIAERKGSPPTPASNAGDENLSRRPQNRPWRPAPLPPGVPSVTRENAGERSSASVTPSGDGRGRKSIPSESRASAEPARTAHAAHSSALANPSTVRFPHGR